MSTRTTTTSAATTAERGSGAFTAEEKAAMKERAAEARAEARASKSAAKAAEKLEEDRRACEAKIAELGDEGSFWPNAWAVTELTTADEQKVTALVRRAVG